MAGEVLVVRLMVVFVVLVLLMYPFFADEAADDVLVAYCRLLAIDVARGLVEPFADAFDQLVFDCFVGSVVGQKLM